jgi:hypothetical protein
MQTWAGVTIAGAALLVISGLPKLWHPQGTVAALHAVGASRIGPVAAQLLTVVEIGIGAVAVVLGARWADLAVAVTYLGFSLFLVAALRASASTCGCTGRVDTPPTRTHLVMTVGFALGSAAAAVNGSRTGLLAVAHTSRPAISVILLGYAAVVTWFAWVLLNLAPAAGRARQT